MKRFKLIKEYPCSPEKGTIVYKCGIKFESLGHKGDYKECNDKYTTKHLFHEPDSIEKFPEFWKEIK